MLNQTSPLTKVVFIKRVLLFGAPLSRVHDLVALGTVSSSWYDAFYKYRALIDILLLENTIIKPNKADHRPEVASFFAYTQLLEALREAEDQRLLLLAMKNILLSRCCGEPKLIRFLEEVFFPGYGKCTSTSSAQDDEGREGQKQSTPEFTLVPPSEPVIQIFATERGLANFQRDKTPWKAFDVSKRMPIYICIFYCNMSALTFLLKASDKALEKFCKTTIEKFPDPAQRQQFFFPKQTSSTSIPHQPLSSKLPFQLEYRPTTHKTRPTESQYFLLGLMLRVLTMRLKKNTDESTTSREVMEIRDRFVAFLEHFAKQKSLIDKMTFHGVDLETAGDMPLRIPYDLIPSLHYLCVTAPDKVQKDGTGSFLASQEGPQTAKVAQKQFISSNNNNKNENKMGSGVDVEDLQSMLKRHKESASASGTHQDPREVHNNIGLFTYEMLPLGPRHVFPDDMMKKVFRMFFDDFKWPREARVSDIRATILQQVAYHGRTELVKFLVEEMGCNPFALTSIGTTLELVQQSDSRFGFKPDGSDAKIRNASVIEYLQSLEKISCM